MLHLSFYLKGKGRDTGYSAAYTDRLWPAALYSHGSGNWLARADIKKLCMAKLCDNKKINERN